MKEYQRRVVSRACGLGYILVWTFSLKNAVGREQSWGKGQVRVRIHHVRWETWIKTNGPHEGSEFFLHFQRAGNYNSVRNANRGRFKALCQRSGMFHWVLFLILRSTSSSCKDQAAVVPRVTLTGDLFVEVIYRFDLIPGSLSLQHRSCHNSYFIFYIDTTPDLAASYIPSSNDLVVLQPSQLLTPMVFGSYPWLHHYLLLQPSVITI